METDELEDLTANDANKREHLEEMNTEPGKHEKDAIKHASVQRDEPFKMAGR